MSKNSGITVQEQLALRVDQGISQQLDDVILKVRSLAKTFKIEQIKERSPLKNVVTTANEPITSLEVIKNFVRYQAGRKTSSDIWRLKDLENPNKSFADEVVSNLNGLSNNCKLIIDEIEGNIRKSLQDDDLSEEQKERLHELSEHIKTNKSEIIQSIHLRLARLYLGYLSREHTAIVKPN